MHLKPILFQLKAILFWFIILLGFNPNFSINTAIKDKPNILWLVCEDQSPYWFSFYGDSTIHLPNLERLAREGVIYDKAYAPVPVCSPARSAIITGMYPSTLGTHNMRAFNPYKPANEEDINIPSYSALVPKGVKPFTEYLRAEGYYCTNNAKEDYNFEKLPSMWDESSQKAHWRNRSSEQPFFSVFNFNVSHESVIWYLGEDSLFVDPKEVPLPPHFPDDPIVRHDLAVNYSNLKRMDRQVGKILKELEEDGLLDKTTIFFYGDHGGPFPRHKRSLYETGTRVPFLVRHHDQAVAGTRSDEMISFIDLAPTVLSLAGINIPEVIQGEAFLGPSKSTTERKILFATSDRFDEQFDQKRSAFDKEWKYIRNTYPEKPYAIPVSYRLNMPMMNRWIKLDSANLLGEGPKRWMAKTKPKEELYDLKNDPWELNNLINDDEFLQHHLRLSNALDEWIIASKDLGQKNEYELIKLWRPEGNQPLLSPPTMTQQNDTITLVTERDDTTIIWKRIDDVTWSIYTKPIKLKASEKIQFQQVRIGYHSEIEEVQR